MRRLGATAVVLAGLAACDDSVEFSLRLEWKRSTAEDSAQACPTLDGRYTCEAIPISCDARVRVRIVGALNDQTYFSQCIHLEANGDACMLGQIDLSQRPIPNEMVRVQVVVWTVAELAASGFDFSDPSSDGCPVSTPFELSGLPRLTTPPDQAAPPREPVPALGGEAYFQVGASPVATVTLGCPQYDALDAVACRDNSVAIDATIKDPKTFTSLLRPDTGNPPSVFFGAPVDNDDGGKRIDEDQFVKLDMNDSGPLLWRGHIVDLPEGISCLRTDHESVSGKTLHCFDTPEPVDGAIEVDGFLIGRNTYNALLTVADPQFATPEGGIVLGVVRDANGVAVEGATVSTDPPSTIIYPGDPESQFAAVRTSTGPKGYFVSQNAKFNSEWKVDGPGMLREVPGARGGIVDFHATLVVVRLNGALPPSATP